MNFRILRALPPGGLRSRRPEERHSIRWTLPGRTSYVPTPGGDACVLGVVERAGNALRDFFGRETSGGDD